MEAKASHSILPYVVVWLLLLGLTAATVSVARLNLGSFHLAAALCIATVKSALVVMVFMHLRENPGANKLVFGTAIVFVLLLLSLTVADVATRGGVFNYQPARASGLDG